MGSKPSGNLTYNYGKIHHFPWENTISMAMFNSYVANYQRVDVAEKLGKGGSFYGEFYEDFLEILSDLIFPYLIFKEQGQKGQEQHQMGVLTMSKF